MHDERDTEGTRRLNVTISASMYAHLVATYPEGKRAQAMEDAYRAQHGMPPRPPVQERGRFTSERNPRKKP
jgi:hypothetical protein